MMLKWFGKFFKSGDAEKVNASKRYEETRRKLSSEDKKDRLAIARDHSTTKEILYYLGEKDPDPDIRKAVAENPSSPYQLSPILARDQSPDVRMALAERLLILLPDLSCEKQSQLYAYTVQALGNLALDEVLKIRVALSSALKDYAYAPPKVVGQLARDIERRVSEPVLLYCSALKDEDLLEILKGHPEGWAVQAIAQRKTVSEPVSDAVIDTGDVKAGEYLLQNEGAEITLSVLEKIIVKAQNTPEWKKPVASRANLPEPIARKLADVADESIREILMKRTDISEDAKRDITKAFRRRLEFANEKESGVENTSQRIHRYKEKGILNEETISDALAMRDYDLVKNALATLAGIHPKDVDRVISLKAPKAIIALCWKAGLSMRLALQLQKELLKVPLKDLIYPRDGVDYPFENAELEWQLDFLDLRGA